MSRACAQKVLLKFSLTQFLICFELEVKGKTKVTRKLSGILILQVLRDVDPATRNLRESTPLIILASAVVRIAEGLLILIFEEPAVFWQHQVIRDVDILGLEARGRRYLADDGDAVAEELLRVLFGGLVEGLWRQQEACADQVFAQLYFLFYVFC